MPTVAKWLLCAVLLPGLPVQAACPPEGQDRDGMLRIKAQGFAISDPASRQAMALALLDCLGQADPVLRDGVAFEGLSHWLRSDQLDLATRRRMLERLPPMLAPGTDPGDGFQPPFAALVLSELARTDRLSPWLDPGQRRTLVDDATAYLGSVRDYRGFDPEQGWRHGVAHGADLVMQLVLNPALGPTERDALLAAVSAQVAPPQAPPYVHGESERLARPVILSLQRGHPAPGDWPAWLQGVVAPAPLADWSQAYASPAGLARRHNTRAFLLALYAGLRESGSDELQAYVPAVVAALREVE